MNGGQSQKDRVLIATFAERVGAYWQAEEALMSARLELHRKQIARTKAQLDRTEAKLDRVAETFARLA